MSNIPMNYLNNQRRVLNSMHDHLMPMLSNQYSVPLPPNQNQERNPESKINLAFGLLRKNTARTNGIWKIIQSLINRLKKIEEMTTMIDQVIKRNEELEDKRRKNNKKRNEKKRIKREKRKEDKKKLEGNKKQKERPEQKEKKEIDVQKTFKLVPEIKKEEQEINIKNEETRISRNSNDEMEISRKKFDSRNNKKDSINNLEISRTNLSNKKINKKINNKKIINNKDEIAFKVNDECSLQLADKINQAGEKLSRNGRNRQKVTNLVNRFIFNNNNIYRSNQTWINRTFVPLIEDIIDLDMYDLDVSDYVKKIRSPPEFRNKFWQWWKKRDIRNQMEEISRITQKLKQSKDPDIMKFFHSD